MTTNKSYFNQWLKRSGVGEVINNFPKLPVVEIKVDAEHIKKGYGALDPRYIMCISGQPATLTDGSLNSGLNLIKQLTNDSTLTIFFVHTKEEALKVLNDPTTKPGSNHSNRLGTSTIIPTSINAFKAWCIRNNVDIKLCQRMAQFDPASISIKAPQRDYYWCEVEVSDLKSELQLDQVPHKFEMRDGIKIAIVLLKAGGQYKPKKMLLIEKALKAAQLQRTEESARFYVELFLQKSVGRLNLENVNWNAPDIGMQLVNAVVGVTDSAFDSAFGEGGNDDKDDIEIPSNTSFDF